MSVDTKHTVICAELREKIASGALNGQLKSIPTLAEEYGVASVTMRKALNTLKGEGLLEAQSGVGTFVREPERKKTGLIGLVMHRGLQHQAANFYAMSTVMGLQSALSKEGYSVLFSGSSNDLLEKGNEYGADALCLYEVFDADVPRYLSGFCPVLSLEGPVNTGDFDTVHVDNTMIGKMCADLLIGEGYENILYMGIDKAATRDPAWALREAGFRKTVDTAGITAQYVPMTRTPHETRAEMIPLLDSVSDYDSIVINGGYPGSLVMELLPDQDPASIVVIGNPPDAQMLSCNVLGGDFFKVGEAASRSIIRRLRNPDAPAYAELVPAVIHRDKDGVRWPDDPEWNESPKRIQ